MRRTTISTMLLTLPVALAGCWAEEEARVPDPPRTVRTEVVRMAEPAQVRRFPAVLEPPEITPLAFDVAGRLGALDLRTGQAVRAGEVLASVEAQGADLRLRQAEAALAEAETAAAEAGRDAGRQRQLFERGVAARAALDDAEAEASGAAARAEQARRALDLVREDVADTTLRAPFDGVVDAVEAQSFGTVAAGQPVVTLYEDAGLQATVPVSYALAARLEVGEPARVRPLDGDPAPMPATITEVARRAPAVSSFPVVVTLDGERPGLRSGMAVEVLIDLPAPEGARGLALPLSALATQRPSDLSGPEGRMAEVFVHVPGEGGAGTVEPRTVRIGAVEGDRMFVTHGLDPGARVATAGVPFLDPGMEVRLEADAAASDAPVASAATPVTPTTAVAEAGR